MGKIYMIFLRASLSDTLLKWQKHARILYSNNLKLKRKKNRSEKQFLFTAIFFLLCISFRAVELLFSTKMSRWKSLQQIRLLERLLAALENSVAFYFFLIATNINWKNCTHSWRWTALHVKNKSADVHLMRLNQMAFFIPALQLSLRTQMHNVCTHRWYSNQLFCIISNMLAAYVGVQTSESFGGS